MAQSQSQGLGETRNGCPMPPYNTLNFNSSNPMVFSTLQSFALNSPQYPLPPGANVRQVADNQSNVAYFNSLNQQTLAIASTNTGASLSYDIVKYFSPDLDILLPSASVAKSKGAILTISGSTF